MPQAKTVVLDISKGVSPKDYARTLNALKDGMDDFREEQGWCSEFWSYITSTISGVFQWSNYEEKVTVYTDTVGTDAERAEQLRLIRGRILRYVGERIQLPRANDILRNAGLPEYVQDVNGNPWSVRVPGISFVVSAKADPTLEIQAKFREFLDGFNDEQAEYHAGRLYAQEANSNYHVPVRDTVQLLGQ